MLDRPRLVVFSGDGYWPRHRPLPFAGLVFFRLSEFRGNKAKAAKREKERRKRWEEWERLEVLENKKEEKDKEKEQKKTEAAEARCKRARVSSLRRLGNIESWAERVPSGSVPTGRAGYGPYTKGISHRPESRCEC